ncbi:MAG TPA: hypothetical protein VGI52_03750, partial [Solirubrobacteraceae bacterium]
EEDVPDAPGHQWQDSLTVRDSGRLRLALRREPKDVPAADDLIWRVLWQAGWHFGLADAWRSSVGVPGEIAEVIALDRALAAKDAFERTPAECDELALRLDAVRRTLKRPAEPELPMTKADPKVDWDVDPAHFKGWAVFDGTEFGRVRARVERPVWSPPPRTPNRARLSPGDLTWTLLPILFSCLVYTLTIYSRTWGSVKDVLTALAAGVVGKVVIDYAALPLFRSPRLRPSKSPTVAAE